METTKNRTDSILPKKEEIVKWFESFIGEIKVDQLAMEIGVAHQEKTNFYLNAITGNEWELAKTVRNSSSQYFIQNITGSFLRELIQRKALPKKIAFSLSPSTISVWAEINDDDDALQDQILLAEAKINVEYKDTNFALDTMIVEESDKLGIPPHYTSIPIHFDK